jgi:hypothetical protein
MQVMSVIVTLCLVIMARTVINRMLSVRSKPNSNMSLEPEFLDMYKAGR